MSVVPPAGKLTTTRMVFAGHGWAWVHNAKMEKHSKTSSRAIDSMISSWEFRT
jgi:hypothetical protein